jgi:hypothetical protein
MGSHPVVTAQDRDLASVGRPPCRPSIGEQQLDVALAPIGIHHVDIGFDFADDFSAWRSLENDAANTGGGRFRRPRRRFGGGVRPGSHDECGDQHDERMIDGLHCVSPASHCARGGSRRVPRWLSGELTQPSPRQHQFTDASGTSTTCCYPWSTVARRLTRDPRRIRQRRVVMSVRSPLRRKPGRPCSRQRIPRPNDEAVSRRPDAAQRHRYGPRPPAFDGGPGELEPQ